MNSKTFSIVLKFIRKNILLYIGLVFIALLISLLSSLINPEILRRIIGAITESRFSYLFSSILLFVASILSGILLKSLNVTLLFGTNRKCVYEMEERFLDHYSKLKYWNLVINPSDVLALFRQNINAVTNDLNTFGFSILQLSFSIVFAVIYAAIINWYVLIICIVVIGIMIVLSQRGVSKLPIMSEQLTNERNRLHAISWEHIKNTEIAGFLNIKRTVKGYVDTNEEYLSKWLSLKKIYNRSQLFSMFGSKIIVLLIAIMGGVMNIYGKVNLSDIFALVIVIPIISNSLFEIPNRIAEFKQLSGKFSAMDAFFKIETDEISNEPSELFYKLENLSIIDLCYKYPNQERNVLDNITLNISSGLTCFIGPSGCGKTTLLRICACLLPYDKGQVLWNGTDNQYYNRMALWKTVSYLNQTPYIIPGTLLSNITLGQKVQNHEERLARAIEDAGLIEFFSKNDYDINMEVDASKLSNGELQKICFARAFYGQYDVLLLDEATSALDPSVEMSIINAIKRRIVEEKILVIAIAHRVRLIENADKVILLIKGKIESIGTHRSLLDTSECYKKLIYEDMESVAE